MRRGKSSKRTTVTSTLRENKELKRKGAEIKGKKERKENNSNLREKKTKTNHLEERRDVTTQSHEEEIKTEGKRCSKKRERGKEEALQAISEELE